MARVRWAVIDGASVAFQVSGTGPDVVEVQAGAGLLWDEHPLTRAWPERVREFARLTTFDCQGTGRSDPLPARRVPSLDDKVAEALAVMDAAEVREAVLVGWFGGVPPALELAARHPERVRGVVAVNGYARLLAGDDNPGGVARAVREEFERDVAEQFGTGWMVRRWVPELADQPEVKAFMEDYEQALARRGQIALGAKLVSELDVRARLPEVRAPVVVIHARDNQVVPVALARDLHDRLPGSRYLEVPTSSHLFVVPPMLDAVVNETRAMTTGEDRPSTVTTLAALLFTDIVRSTERVAALADHNWAAVLSEYQQLAARTVVRFGGRRVNTTGDGLLAVFTSAAAAIRAGAALIADGERLGLVTRTGIHVGEVQDLDGDVAGLSVHIAARTLDSSPAGGVVMTDSTARAIVGTGIRTHPIGTFQLRGVPGEWPLHQLDL